MKEQQAISYNVELHVIVLMCQLIFNFITILWQLHFQQPSKFTNLKC
jgi:hypothetical protein